MLNLILTVSVPIFFTVLCLIFAIAFAFGWITATLYFKKQVRDNPPISESQIRELYRQAGKKLSEKQVLQIMNSLKRQQN